MAERKTNYVFTLCNYTDAEVEYYQKLKCKWIQFGKEICPTTGTPHLQGAIVFKDGKTHSAAKKTLKRSRCEVMEGTVQQNIIYTGKEGHVFTNGTPPLTQEEKGQKSKEYYAAARKAMREADEDNIPEQIKCMHPDLVKKHRRDFLSTQKLEDVTEQHIWLYGVTGSGKSRLAREMADNQQYDKDFTKWWDGYTTQDYVLIDDIDTSHQWMLCNLKRWADRYPFPSESKNGGKIQIRPKKIIVTSNFRIQDIWELSRDHDPLLRRFEQREI